MLEIQFSSALWVYQSKAAWYFLTVPKEDADHIKHFVPRRNGFGSVKVSARIGETQWQTSIFPDSKSGGFFLPIKAAVRKAEDLQVDRLAVCTLAIDVPLD